MIVQAIGLLDDLDKELNTYAMRVREWYGWHFPEMTKIVADNIAYAKAVSGSASLPAPRPRPGASAAGGRWGWGWRWGCLAAGRWKSGGAPAAAGCAQAHGLHSIKGGGGCVDGPRDSRGMRCCTPPPLRRAPEPARLPLPRLQIKHMGTRDKAAGLDFSGVLPEEVEAELKDAAVISMGTEISAEDLDNIGALADQVRAGGWHGCPGWCGRSSFVAVGAQWLARAARAGSGAQPRWRAVGAGCGRSSAARSAVQQRPLHAPTSQQRPPPLTTPHPPTLPAGGGPCRLPRAAV
jgi:hypothetical protein